MYHPESIKQQAKTICDALAVLRHAKAPSFYRIRRGHDLMDAQLEPVFHKLKAELPRCPEDLLALALLLAARADGGTTLMEGLALDNSRSQDGANDIRVARFIRNTSPMEVFTHAQRFIAQCKGQVSPYDVAAVALRWHGQGLDALRKNLLSAYFRESSSI